ncbi:MAG: TetR/AcrR family transcriptional regulator [Candidatus Dormibacteraeota bacterium]|nr:TetR/AcrR family transcriptional regulator [Candidatus Dormibacteraeota bacterium]MBO0761087.1 TetR/AcrR family transcriptional regulator [Candidatus Dormibacteraeota bacterium]
MRPLRADARRNRERVLEAAADVLTTEGLAVPTEEIARRAGVGIGTLFRHFPTKEALVEAVLAHRIEQLTQDARALTAAADPGVAFFEFFSEMVRQAVVNRALSEALSEGPVQVTETLAGVKQGLMAAFGALLTRAQEAGAVRPDVDVADVGSLVAGCLAMEHSSHAGGEPGRLLAVVCDGLRGGA